MAEARKQLPENLSFSITTKDTWYKTDDLLFITRKENAVYTKEVIGCSCFADSSAINKAGGVKVAGYPLKQIYLYGVSAPDGKGSLASDWTLSSLIYAVYYFDVKQTDAVYADLTSKLTSLYGDVDLNREQDGVVQNLWYGADGTMVSLVNNSGSVSIRYSFSGADELIANAYQTLHYGEVMLAQDNVDGL